MNFHTQNVVPVLITFLCLVYRLVSHGLVFIVFYCVVDIILWMCDVKIKDRVPSKELRERLGIDDIILILQQNWLRWYGHVLREEDTDWVKKCMEYEVEGSRPRGRPEDVERGCAKRLPST